MDAAVQLASEHMSTLSSDFRAGTINASQFLDGMLSEIKAINVASALAAYGGREQMTQSRYGVIGQLVRQQYAYARQMVADVLDGKQRMNGRLDARARQYANSGRVAYETIRRREMAQAGLAFERNVRHSDEGCPECVAASDEGWVPIGSLPPIGARICRGACLCTLAFSATRSEAEAA